MSTAEIIKTARTRAGITQAELARRTGTAQSAIARYESGAVDPKTKTLERLIAACGYGIDVRLVRPKIDPHDALLMERTLAMSPEARLTSIKNATRLIHELKKGRDS